MRIVISSGHGLFVPGAVGLIDEVNEARRVTDRVSDILRGVYGISVNTFHENDARTVSNNVGAIVRHHNSQARDLDVSIHFNAVAGGTRKAGIGVETLYRTGNSAMRTLARNVSKAISEASGLILRNNGHTIQGAWARNNLSFLTNTTATAILIEICFVNSVTDVFLYNEHFEEICHAIAEEISGRKINMAPKPSLPLVTLDMSAHRSSIQARRVDNRWLVTVKDFLGNEFEIRLRDILETFGYQLSWNQSTNTVTGIGIEGG